MIDARIAVDPQRPGLLTTSFLKAKAVLLEGGIWLAAAHIATALNQTETFFRGGDH